MGASVSATLSPEVQVNIPAVWCNAESPTGSGLKSVLTGPLDEYGDFLSIWYGLLHVLKNWTNIDQRDRSPHDASRSGSGGTLRAEFSIRKAVPSCPGPEQRYLGWLPPDALLMEKYQVNKSTGEVFSELYKEETEQEPKIILSRTFVLHRSPALLLEAWAEEPGRRLYGAALRDAVQETVDRILLRLHPKMVPHEVQFHIKPDRCSLVSDPFDEYLDFDRLWVEWLDMIKYTQTEEHGRSSLVVLSDAKFTVQKPKAQWTEFEWLQLDPQRTIPTDECTIEYQLNKVAGKIHAYYYFPAGKMVMRTWTVIRRNDLLRIEVKGERPGRRMHGELLQGVVKYVVERLLDRMRRSQERDMM